MFIILSIVILLFVLAGCNQRDADNIQKKIDEENEERRHRELIEAWNKGSRKTGARRIKRIVYEDEDGNVYGEELVEEVLG